VAEYIVDQYSFRSKKAAEDYLSKMLNSHEVGMQVTDPELTGFLTALAHRHPNPAEKIGNGISHWVVMRNNDLPGFASSHLGFRIVQVDSSTPVPFSYSKVIRPLSDQSKFAAAMTMDALAVTRGYRREAFDRGPVICAETGESIPDIHDAQAIHRNPGLGQLHQMFLAREGLTRDQVEIYKPDGKSEYRLVDRHLARRWVEFQKDNLAGMRIVKTRRARERD
jgi:hypothetical protein